MALDDLEDRGWKKRTWVWGVGAAVLVLALGGYFLFRKRAPDAPKFETAKVDRGPVVARVTATGVVSALVTVQVGSQVSGRIAELHADFNTPVKKGQLIAKIDPQLFEASMEQARANYLAAQAAYTRSKVQAEDASRQAVRSQQLRAQGLISQADLDTSQANADVMKASVDAAQAAVAQNRAGMHQAEVNLQYTNIIAPINGTVISRSVELGQTVASALQAPTLFTIAEDLRRMQVDTSIAEADVGKLQPGQTATFIVDAFPNERFNGTIRQIRNAATTLQNVVTYDAVIDVENPDLKLRPGMTANVTVVYAQKQDALRVVNAALRFRPGGAGNFQRRPDGGTGPTKPRAEPAPNQKTLFILKDGNPSPVRVTTGVTDGTTTEIVDGPLEEGAWVITSATTDTAASAPTTTRALGAPSGPPGGGRGPRGGF